MSHCSGRVEGETGSWERYASWDDTREPEAAEAA